MVFEWDLYGIYGNDHEFCGIYMVFEWDLYGIYGNDIFFPTKLEEICGSYQHHGAYGMFLNIYLEKSTLKSHL